MSEKLRITSIRFRNYKAFQDYSISLNPFNVLVGPKEVFSALNAHLQAKYKISLNPIFVVESFLREEISSQIIELLQKLEAIRKENAPDQAALEFSP